jgi:hypothetical protein
MNTRTPLEGSLKFKGSVDSLIGTNPDLAALRTHNQKRRAQSGRL